MRLAKYRLATGEISVGQYDDDLIRPLDLSGRQYRTLSDILEAENPLEVADFLVDRRRSWPLSQVTLRPPIDQQEVWAAGVTYRRSRSARMEESAAAASCYDRVYSAARPELFFKATPNRVAGTGDAVRIRSDSQWNVPEPEITLVLNPRLELVGFTIGNDMSSRDIEGENPLYLPQAKVYDACCALGPCVTLAAEMPPHETIEIRMAVRRQGDTAFEGRTNVGQMARTFDELIGWLKRDNRFPHGAMLLTGTGIVPDREFTLHVGDVVVISIDGIGTLINHVIQG